MFMMRQGDLASAKRIDDLEKRIEMLENVVKALQEKNARIGRPPKERNNVKENFGGVSNTE
jgi:chaperonin cofactor prefoldin